MKSLQSYDKYRTLVLSVLFVSVVFTFVIFLTNNAVAEFTQ
jgi:hypothetical protein